MLLNPRSHFRVVLTCLLVLAQVMMGAVTVRTQERIPEMPEVTEAVHREAMTTTLSDDAFMALYHALEALNSTLHPNGSPSGPEVETTSNLATALTPHAATLRAAANRLEMELDETRQRLAALHVVGKVTEAKLAIHDDFAIGVMEQLRLLVDTLDQAMQSMEANAATPHLAQLEMMLESLMAMPLPQPSGSSHPLPLMPQRPEEPPTDENAMAALQGVTAFDFPAPTAADLATSSGTEFTPILRDLAATLGHDPSKIYDYVHNEVRFEPYLGVARGATGTYWAEAGNDRDLASLTIALLRIAQIPARYVTGSIRLPKSVAANVVGVTDEQAAVSIYYGHGSWEKWLSNDEFQLKMTWVIAYVDGQWVHLVPWYKEQIVYDGVDFRDILALDGQTLLAEMLEGADYDNDAGWYAGINGGQMQAQLGEIGARIEEYMLDNHTGESILSVFGGAKIRPRSHILFALPFDAVEPPLSYPAIAETEQVTIQFRVGGIDYPLKTTELSGKRITLNFIAHSDEDQAILEEYGSIFEAPAYLVTLRPVLWIDGIPVATGDPVSVGQSLPVRLVDDTEENSVSAGGFYNILLPVGKISAKFMAHQLALLTEFRQHAMSGDQEVTQEQLLGQLLYVQNLTYWQQLGNQQEMSARVLKLQTFLRASFVSFVELDNQASFMNGSPYKLFPSSANIDIRLGVGCLQIAWRQLPDENEEELDVTGQLNRYMNAPGSAWEHLVFENTRHVPATSAAHALQLANAQGMPVYRITAQNLESALAALEYSEEFENRLREGVGRGTVFTLHQRPLLYHGAEIVGYVTDSSIDYHGAGSWIISAYRKSNFGGVSLDDYLSVVRDPTTILVDIGGKFYEFGDWIEVEPGKFARQQKIIVEGLSESLDKLGNAITAAGLAYDIGKIYYDVLYEGTTSVTDGQAKILTTTASTIAGMAAAAAILSGIAIAPVAIPAVAAGAMVGIGGYAAGKMVEWGIETLGCYEGACQPGGPQSELAQTSTTLLTWQDHFTDTQQLRWIDQGQVDAGALTLSQVRDYGFMGSFARRVDAMTWGSDDQLYLTLWPGGELARFNPTTQQVEKLGVPVEGAMSIWTLVRGHDNRIYGGTGNGSLGYVFAYDPATDEVTNYGPPALPDERSGSVESSILALVAHSNGSIYGGTYPKAHFFALNPQTAEFTFYDPPVAETTAIGALVEVGALVYGATSPRAHLFTFNPATAAFQDFGLVLPEAAQVTALVAGADGKVYGSVLPGGKLFVFDPATGKIAALADPVPGEDAIYDLVVGSDGLLYGATGPHGYLFAFDPATNQNLFTTLLDSGATYVASLAVGSAGEIYAGTSGIAKLFAYIQSNYQNEGIVRSAAISLPLGGQWKSLLYEAVGDGVIVDLLDSKGNLLLADVANNTDLSTIDSSVYRRLKLRATLTSSDSNQSPQLTSWALTYTQPGGLLYTPLVMAANLAPFEPNAPSPSHGAGNQSIDVKLKWEGGDPNAGLLTYTVFFGIVSEDGSGTLVGHTIADRTEFDPGVLQPNTSYGWKVMVEDEYGLESEGPYWYFVTGDAP